MESEAVLERDKGKGKEKVDETDQQSSPEESTQLINTSDLRDRYAKAKIEEPNLRLPKALLKPDCDPTDDLCYMKIFEDDTRKAQHLAEAIAAGAQAARKVYRIRNKELVKVLGENFEGLKQIHRESKSTIGLLADPETNFHRQTFLDLVGTVEQVRTAEELILDKILQTYDNLVFPIILMPPTIYRHYMLIPLHKVTCVWGVYRSNIRRMEMISGAWIKIDAERPPPGGSEWERGVHIYGPREHVIKATSLVQSAISEPWESGEAISELQKEFEEPGSDVIFHDKKSALAAGESSVVTKQTEEEDDKHKKPEKKKQQVEEGTSSGGKEFKIPRSYETFHDKKSTATAGESSGVKEFKVPRSYETFHNKKSAAAAAGESSAVMKQTEKEDDKHKKPEKKQQQVEKGTRSVGKLFKIPRSYEKLHEKKSAAAAAAGETSVVTKQTEKEDDKHKKPEKKQQQVEEGTSSVGKEFKIPCSFGTFHDKKSTETPGESSVVVKQSEDDKHTEPEKKQQQVEEGTSSVGKEFKIPCSFGTFHDKKSTETPGESSVVVKQSEDDKHTEPEKNQQQVEEGTSSVGQVFKIPRPYKIFRGKKYVTAAAGESSAVAKQTEEENDKHKKLDQKKEQVVEGTSSGGKEFEEPGSLETLYENKSEAAAGESSTVTKQTEDGAGESSAVMKQTEVGAGESSTVTKQTEDASGGSSTVTKQTDHAAGESSAVTEQKEDGAGESLTVMKQTEDGAGESSAATKQTEDGAGESSTVTKQTEDAARGSSTVTTQTEDDKHKEPEKKQQQVEEGTSSVGKVFKIPRPYKIFGGKKYVAAAAGESSAVAKQTEEEKDKHKRLDQKKEQVDEGTSSGWKDFEVPGSNETLYDKKSEAAAGESSAVMKQTEDGAGESLAVTKQTEDGAGESSTVMKQTEDGAGESLAVTKQTGDGAGESSTVTKQTEHAAGESSAVTKQTEDAAGESSTVTKQGEDGAGESSAVMKQTEDAYGEASTVTKQTEDAAEVSSAVTKQTKKEDDKHKKSEKEKQQVEEETCSDGKGKQQHLPGEEDMRG